MPCSYCTADDIPLEVISSLGHSVMVAVGEKRSTWRRWNLTAEAARQTMGYRFASIEDREPVVDLVVDAAEVVSLRLTPPERAGGPAVFQRPRRHERVPSKTLDSVLLRKTPRRGRPAPGPGPHYDGPHRIIGCCGDDCRPVRPGGAGAEGGPGDGVGQDRALRQGC